MYPYFNRIKTIHKYSPSQKIFADKEMYNLWCPWCQNVSIVNQANYGGLKHRILPIKQNVAEKQKRDIRSFVSSFNFNLCHWFPSLWSWSCLNKNKKEIINRHQNKAYIQYSGFAKQYLTWLNLDGFMEKQIPRTSGVLKTTFCLSTRLH